MLYVYQNFCIIYQGLQKSQVFVNKSHIQKNDKIVVKNKIYGYLHSTYSIYFYG